MHEIRVGNRIIGHEKPCFIIAEAGSNHNGSLERAKKLIDIAVKAKADAVKFQSINFEKLYVPEEQNEKFKTFFKKIEFPEDWHYKLSSYARKKGIIFLSTPTYFEAVDILEKINVKAYKIASTQAATHLELVRYVASKGKPIFLSTGLVNHSGIARALKACYEQKNRDIVLLHCNAIYPTPPKFVNLRYISTLQRAFGHPVGFSDHTMGFHVTLAAVALGACVIEKHFTTSRRLRGPDHHFSLEPAELKEMVERIRELEQALGDGRKAGLRKEEKAILESVRLKLVAEKNLEAGKKILKTDISFKRSKKGIPAEMLPRVLCCTVKKRIKRGEPLTWGKLTYVKKAKR